FCSARGIGPNAFTQGAFDEYRLHLDESLLKTPDETFASTVRTWQRAEVAIKGWPQIGVSIPDRRRHCISRGTAFRNRSSVTARRGATGSPGAISWRTRHSDRCGQRPSLIGNGRSAALPRP